MFVIMIYDVNVGKVTKVLKIGRKYLNHIQNSALEGDLSAAQYKKLKYEITRAINPEHDSVRFYLLRATQYMTVDKLGVPSRSGDLGDFL